MLDKIWVALKFGGLTLKTLKLDGCQFSKKLLTSPPGLKEFFSTVVMLKYISFAETLLPSDVLKYVVS